MNADDFIRDAIDRGQRQGINALDALQRATFLVSELALIEALAVRLGVSRDEMLARCIARGLDEIEANHEPTDREGT